jgi:hypothetical protein
MFYSMADLSSLIAQYRDADSPVLSVNWALLRLLDQAGSEHLREDLRKVGQPWEIMTATERAWEAVPDEPGLYLFVWRPWFAFDVVDTQPCGDLRQVLYVGKAGTDDAGRRTGSSLRQRYRSYSKHLRSDPDVLWSRSEPRTRSELLDRYLCLRPLEYWFTTVERYEHVPVLEDRLIKMLNPPCNRQRVPKITARLGRATPAF